VTFSKKMQKKKKKGRTFFFSSRKTPTTTADQGFPAFPKKKVSRCIKKAKKGGRGRKRRFFLAGKSCRWKGRGWGGKKGARGPGEGRGGGGSDSWCKTQGKGSKKGSVFPAGEKRLGRAGRKKGKTGKDDFISTTQEGDARKKKVAALENSL